MANLDTTTAVDVFLGHPLVDETEKHFLQRLRSDLAARGISAVILANVVAPPRYRQVDFVIATATRTVLCELKGYAGPIIGSSNGHWQRLIEGSAVGLDRNAFRQAQDQVFGLSDAMRQYARKTGARGPRQRGYYEDIDAVICCYPSVPRGSRFDPFPYVSVVGYDELLERLQQPGRSLAWSRYEWDAFVRYLNLYRDEDDLDSVRALHDQNTIVADYCARFVEAVAADLPPFTPTSVLVDGQSADRPDLAALLTGRRRVLLRGSSGAGKSLWARVTALELARSGHVPIWLHASTSESSLRASLSRATAAYTTHTPSQLLAAAEAGGRAVVLIVDGINEVSAKKRASVIEGAKALIIRGTSRNMLITSQGPVAGVESMTDIELLAPNETERRAILAAYDAASIGDTGDAFVTPFHLSLAAACAADLEGPIQVRQLLDAFVHRATRGEAVREALRNIAWRMHEEVRWSLPAPEAMRVLRRDLALNAHEAELVLGSRLLSTSQGYVRFTHERFAVFLATEHLLVSRKDPTAAAVELNEPRNADLRTDAVALETDEKRLAVLLSALTDSYVLARAAASELGEPAGGAARLVLREALEVARQRTTAEQGRFNQGDVPGIGDAWDMTHSMSPAERAQLQAAGACLRHGLFIDDAAALLDATETRCLEIKQTQPGPGLHNRLVAATYALAQPNAAAGLPASILVQAACHPTHRHSFGRDDDLRTAAAIALLDRPVPGSGALLLAAALLRPVTALGARHVVRAATASLTDGAYHLQLAGLQLVEIAARQLQADEKQVLVDAISALETDNIALSSAIVETLSALEALDPIRSAADIAAELSELLQKPDNPQMQSRARGFVASQFESDVVGPYYAVITELPPFERSRLISMALRASDGDDMTTHWMIETLEDLTEPEVAGSVLDLVARSDPGAWFSPQDGMAVTVASLRHLAQSDYSLPALMSQDPAWQAFVSWVLAELRYARGRTDANDVKEAWKRAVAERDAVPELLSRLRSARIVSADGFDAIETMLAAAECRDEIVEMLMWALDHPDSLRSPWRWSYGRTEGIIWLLGRIGTRQARPALRRFINDPEQAEGALAAIRAIESRDE